MPSSSHTDTTARARRDEIDQRIWLAVSAIPAGQVASYGEVAKSAGLPGAARRVGRALRGLPEDTGIPWHRVVNASGRLSLTGAAAERQRRRLQDEGVVFRANGRIDPAHYQSR